MKVPKNNFQEDSSLSTEICSFLVGGRVALSCHSWADQLAVAEGDKPRKQLLLLLSSSSSEANLGSKPPRSPSGGVFFFDGMFFLEKKHGAPFSGGFLLAEAKMETKETKP